jgi:hypothetical protein
MSSIYRLAAPLYFVLIGGFGCGSLWGTYSEPDAENCVRNPNACQSGEHCNLETQACEPTDMTPVDPFPPPSAPTTFISPGGLVSTLSTPRPARYTLAAPKPATIYYTLDGTTPALGQSSTMSAQNRITLGPLDAGTMLRWFGDYGAGFDAEAPRSFTAAIDATPPTAAGVISETVEFAAGISQTVTYNLGPVVIVPRGSRLSMRVNFQAWAAQSGGGPLQYVISGSAIGTVGCLDNVESYGPYPGQQLTLFIAFNVPFIPGHYPLVAGITAQPSCDRTPATGPEIAQIFVE